MINLKQELQYFPTIDLKFISESNPGIPDNVKNSIVLYNKALECLKTDSEDIAIIELKKAIAMNPDFHEAMNLLGLCYGYTREYGKAAAIFDRVVSAEKNSIQAMKYLNLLNAGNSQSDSANNKPKGVRKNKDGNVREKHSSWVNDISKFRIKWTSDIPKYIIGFTAGVLLLLLASFVINAVKGDSIKTPVSTNDSAKSSGLEDKDYKEEYDDLNIKFNTLSSKVSKTNEEIEYYKGAMQLFQVDRLVQAGNYEAASDMMIKIKDISFIGAEKEKFDSLYKIAVPKAASKLLTEGIKLTNSKKYMEALSKLNKISIYGNDWTYMDRALYYTGKCHMSLNDSKNAVEAFQQIKDKYPNSKYAKFADSWIKSLM